MPQHYRGKPQIYDKSWGGFGMDTGRVILVLARAYSLVLVVLAAVTLLWLVNPQQVAPLGCGSPSAGSACSWR